MIGERYNRVITAVGVPSHQASDKMVSGGSDSGRFSSSVTGKVVVGPYMIIIVIIILIDNLLMILKLIRFYFAYLYLDHKEIQCTGNKNNNQVPTLYILFIDY